MSVGHADRPIRQWARRQRTGRTKHRFHVKAFRGRNTDGTEQTATWKAALNTVWTQEIGALDPFRLRFVVLEMLGVPGLSPFVLQYSVEDGAWEDARQAPLAAVQYAETIADNADTTQQLSTEQRYITPNAAYGSSADGGLQVNEMALYAGAEIVELEFDLRLNPFSVDPGEWVGFRIRHAWGPTIPWHEVVPGCYAAGAPPSGGDKGNPNR